jgi:lipopolysaccharide biosynthesis regulator YciM
VKRGERKRGFNQFRKVVRDKNKGRFIASCKSCKFFNSDDVCTNPSVTEWDMVTPTDGGDPHCTFWMGLDYDNGRKKKTDEW